MSASFLGSSGPTPNFDSDRFSTIQSKSDVLDGLEIDRSPGGTIISMPVIVEGGGGFSSMEQGITLRSFFMTALNAMITLGFSIPFVFTTAGWLAMVFQVVTGAAIFICILLVKACFDNPEIKRYGEEHRVPVFEREYAFLAGYCGGIVGRTVVTMVVSLEFFLTSAASTIAIGTCANVLIRNLSIELWIIVSAALWLTVVLLPCFDKISYVLGITGAFGAVLGSLLWVASSIMILPDTHIEANLIPRAPYASNLITALGIAIFSSGAAPSLPPFYGVVRNATPQHINLCILVAQIVSVLYVFMLGIAGMQLCDGACGQFYIVTLLDYPSSVIPAWFMYWLVTVQLIRISAASCVYLVPIVVSSEGMILSLMQRFSWGPNLLKYNSWRFIWRILIVAAIVVTSITAEAEIAYIQALTGTLLCSCNLLLFPLWFYLVIERPKGIRIMLVWTAIALSIVFAAVGTYYSISDMLV